MALCAALLASVAMSAPALACSFDLVTVERTMREADRVVLGTVAQRLGVGIHTYTIRVERIIKGPALPNEWVIRNAGSSDCGMPLLMVGQRVVLEFYEPGRITTGPWLYSWRIEPDGTVAFSDSHAPPLPSTLDDLLALYAAAKPPDTSTSSESATGTRGAEPVVVLIASWLVGLLAAWRRAPQPR